MYKRHQQGPVFCCIILATCPCLWKLVEGLQMGFGDLLAGGPPPFSCAGALKLCEFANFGVSRGGERGCNGLQESQRVCR